MKEKCGVVGAGLMGAEIAFVYALAGHEVRLADQMPEKVTGALKRLREIADKGCKRGFYERRPPSGARADHSVGGR